MPRSATYFISTCLPGEHSIIFETKLPDGSPIPDNRLMKIQISFRGAFFHAFWFHRFGQQFELSDAIRIYQQLLRFHTKEFRLDAWIDADISRIQFVYQYAQMPDKDSLYINALGRITSQFPSLPSPPRPGTCRRNGGPTRPKI